MSGAQPDAHERAMAAVYARGASARIVAANGAAGLMNLGYAPPGTRLSGPARQRALVRLVLDALAPRRGETILDLGCGTGGTLAHAARYAPGVRLTGVNVDRMQLGAAAAHLARRGGKGVRLVRADACALPFGAASFDGIYAIELFAHVDDKPALFAECARVLRPGGRFVAAYLTLKRPFAQCDADERAHLARVAATFRERPESYATRAEHERLAAAAGLVPSASRDLTEGVFPPRHAEMLAALRRLRSRAPWDRARAFADVRLRWKTDAASLERFLAAHTARPAQTLFAYHLAVWRKPS